MLTDLIMALKKPQIWSVLSWFDIKQRYKRSVLGPFWVTLSTGVLVGMLSVLWSTLFKLDVREYLPFFSIGQVVWTYISLQLTESCNGFVQFDYIIKQSSTSFCSLILRILSRNVIVFAHNFIIIAIVITLVGPGWHFKMLWFLPGLLILTTSLFFCSIILAIICTRFRDVLMIMQNLLIIAFYFTPIMWKTEQVPAAMLHYINYNPLVYYFNIIRPPLLGVMPDLRSISIALTITAILFLLAMLLLNRTRRRIAYWL